eukprot:jgi/Chlat1/9062/Chrsp94S08321
MSAVVLGKRTHFLAGGGVDDQASASSHTAGSPSLGHAKRLRRHALPPPPPLPARLPTPPATADPLAHLRTLFPDMDPAVVAQVLESCENNIDEAIHRLTSLRLSVGTPPPGGTNNSSSAPATHAEIAAASAADELIQQASVRAQEASDAAASAAASEQTRPLEGAEWVEIVVQEMAAATDMQDARARASRILERFEQFMREHVGAAARKEFLQLRAQLAQMIKDNHILKRAVAIQNARQQEHAEKERELAELRQAVVQFQERLKHAEISNYALAMHLKQAQSQNSNIPNRFHPDVF